jgi:hypothetical protein
MPSGYFEAMLSFPAKSQEGKAMNKRLTALTLGVLLSQAALAQDLTITLTNLTHGSHFTPLLFTAHTAGTHQFQPGQAASASLQAMAEGGNISLLESEANALAFDVVSNPAAGLTAPGQSVSFSMMTQDNNDYLSAVAMILPTNDGFVGLDSLPIPQTPGTYTYYLDAYDAGTEANDEIVNGAGTPGQPGVPGDPLGLNGTGATGVTTTENNQTVHIHRGVLGDTDPTGGISDLDSRVHRWLNPVAKLIIQVNP